MPQQLKVLLTLFAVFIIIFLIIQRLLIPDSFGDLGHYRADALKDYEAKELIHAGKETCIECHDDIYELLISDMHAGLSCEVCHGPGMKHANSMEASDIMINDRREHCGRCHEINPARPKDVITQIDLAEHNADREKCIECHNPHQVWEINE